MEKLFCDLHMHSCLSPCGSDDMTPSNLCGMSMLKGLQMIALTDHNTARNLPAMQACADAYGLLLIPGMEITTRERLPGCETILGDLRQDREDLRPHAPLPERRFGQPRPLL